MLRSRITVACALVAVAGTGALAPGAFAGDDPRSPTTVTIRNEGGDFFGRVRSPDADCKPDRTVKLKRKRPGRDETIATDTTDEQGRWSTGNTGLTNGRYYARVRGTEECRGATSEVIRL
jgi:hypothetical protein